MASRGHFFEILVNIFYAIFALRFRFYTLGATVIILSVPLMTCAYTWGSLDLGWTYEGFAVGSARVAFSFSCGVLIARIKSYSSTNANSWLVPALFVLTATLLVIDPGNSSRALYDASIVLVVWPVIVLTAMKCTPGDRVRIVYHCMGEWSYALYALHFPLLSIAISIRFSLTGLNWHTYQPGFVIMFVPPMIVIAALATDYFDIPLRRKLRAAFGEPRVREEVTQF